MMSIRGVHPVIDLYAGLLLPLTFALMIGILIMQRKRGIVRSGLIWIFMMILIACESINFYHYIRDRDHVYDYEYYIEVIYLPTILLLFICFSFADQHPALEDSNCHRESASIPSLITFSWIDPLIFQAWKKKAITMDDVPGLRTCETSEFLGDTLRQEIESSSSFSSSSSGKKNGKSDRKSLGNPVIHYVNANGDHLSDEKRIYGSWTGTGGQEDVRTETEKRGIMGALWRSFGIDFLKGGIVRAVMDASQFGIPLLLKWLLFFVEQKDEPLWHGYMIIILMFSVYFFYSIMSNNYTVMMSILGTRVRTAVITCVYRKALTVSNSTRRETTAGEIIDLMSVDADRFMVILPLLHLLWSAPIQVAFALFLLFQELGAAIFAGVAVVILFLPFNAWAAATLEKIQAVQMREKDERVKSMNEILNGIKVIKLYAWELAFNELVSGLRAKEVRHLRKVQYLQAGYTLMWTVTPLLVALATFATYVISDDSHVLNAQKVFLALALFNLLRQPLSNMPYLITLLGMTYVSIKRLNLFLMAPDLNNYVTRNESATNDAVILQDATISWSDETAAVTTIITTTSADDTSANNNCNNSNDISLVNDSSIKNISHSTTITSVTRECTNNTCDKKEPFTLKNITIHVKAGSLIAVVGVVGSGKSSLINSILGEMELVSGSVNISPQVKKIAYVPQQAWIQCQTVQENILFGSPLDQRKYDKIVKVCELLPDLEILPARDQTEIGEKGINLSGGQKQRMSLARACYSDSDLYLLDDPLSAVDSHVAKNLFDHVISSKTGILKNKTRIFVTNNLSFLPQVDEIIVMEKGAISEKGSYKELQDREGKFAEFLKEFSVSHPDEPPLSSSDTTSIGNRTSSSFDHSISRSMSIVTEIGVGKKGENANIIEEEKVETGNVKWSVYLHYFRNLSFLPLIVICFVLMQSCDAGCNYWLSLWSQDKMLNVSGEMVVDTDLRDRRLIVFGFLGLGNSVFLMIATLFLANGAVRASVRLHRSLLFGVLRSPMSFFETTPMGRILNRFSKDIESVDMALPYGFLYLTICFLQVASGITMIIVVIPIFVFIISPIIVVYFLVQRFYIASSRQLQRLTSMTRSPIYSQFTETLNGVSTIRAYGAISRFIRHSDEKIDVNLSATICSIIAKSWLSLRLDFVGNIVVFFCALFAVLQRDRLDPGTTGLAVTYALSMSAMLNWLVQCTSFIETEIVSLERVREYSENDCEAEWESRKEEKPPTDWPSRGEVEFQSYSTRYRAGLDLVLKDITAHIRPQEKIGIVGRTGAGKSTITLSVFRMIEPAAGTILIDGIDISRIGLHDLRSRLTIIPQDPVLFSGTLRSNLDPFNLKTDDELWISLELAHLKTFVSGLDQGLDYKVSEGGDNLSVGQRQLICLARALLRKSRILILDEATSAVDMETDSLIQETIRTEFAGSTILTIAHRLHTIMDSNRVAVLNEGSIAEFDSPAVLMSESTSIFSSLAKDAGISS